MKSHSSNEEFKSRQPPPIIEVRNFFFLHFTIIFCFGLYVVVYVIYGIYNLRLMTLH